jgi:hypothetical protein
MSRRAIMVPGSFNQCTAERLPVEAGDEEVAAAAGIPEESGSAGRGMEVAGGGDVFRCDVGAGAVGGLEVGVNEGVDWGDGMERLEAVAGSAGEKLQCAAGVNDGNLGMVPVAPGGAVAFGPDAIEVGGGKWVFEQVRWEFTEEGRLDGGGVAKVAEEGVDRPRGQLRGGGEGVERLRPDEPGWAD